MRPLTPPPATASIDEIIALTGKYLPEKSGEMLRRAFDLACQVYAAHPQRLSGDPYISHPLAVARILATMRLDLPTVISGLLHKALRGKNPTSVAELTELFGPEVARIVSGATKIGDLQFQSQLDYKAENVKKLLLAMSADIRVLLVKLADHLHDMQTATFVEPARQRELAQDTRDLYAPLASRLGIDWIKRELEDLSFQYLNPEEYAALSSQIEMSLAERQAFVDQIKRTLSEKLHQNGIHDFVLLGRPKHLYSIYRKLIAQNISIDKVYDKVAFRVIVQTVGECYEVMGIVHTLWKSIPSRFKDFISSPKANLYQSLHTSVIGPHGDFMEIQIRTREMDELANDGIAAHWAYKEGSAISPRDARLFHWLKQLVQNLQEVDDSQEFLEAVKVELDHAEVYVLTPNGDVKELPTGSTPLDFAYSIHTQIGHHCTGAKINGRLVPLRHELQHGDVVEVITSPGQHPNQGWLALVKTSRARNRIRHWLNQEEQERFLESGREIWERELRRRNLSLKRLIKTDAVRELIRKLGGNALEDLLRKTGSGKITPQAIDEALKPLALVEEKAREPEGGGEAVPTGLPIKLKPGRPRKTGQSPVVIDGVDNVLVKISNCCLPMPGDAIGGFITAGRGVSVHKADCRNLVNADPNRRVPVRWNSAEGGGHKAKVRVLARDGKGLLAAICNQIVAEDAYILDAQAHSSPAVVGATINLVLEVTDREHLAVIIQRLMGVRGVLEARRV
ncbi:MAG: bifunctional (p)ppGpp synthetase/guanosine-3',5'-bis(diphosphate) 3'-pyrophosphohydrolase [Desulfobacteraceae bacterium]|nr:bifunctional (p)ppGpp synthetase/guanosine-3',5'-bis(diphosphate) 3'-pyrophosphohydrolase [Desulfobacteraceae bacterium]